MIARSSTQRKSLRKQNDKESGSRATDAKYPKGNISPNSSTVLFAPDQRIITAAQDQGKIITFTFIDCVLLWIVYRFYNKIVYDGGAWLCKELYAGKGGTQTPSAISRRASYVSS
jgi:hypothetical protein